MTPKPKSRKVRMWGGFVGGKLDWLTRNYGDSTFAQPSVFFTRRDGKCCYDDVRPVTVILPPRKTRKKKV